ncbi:MAG: cupin domain-containing protein [Pigmentiphaga sp.]
MPVEFSRLAVRVGRSGRGAALGLAVLFGALPANAGELKPLAVVAKPLMQTSTTWAGQPLEYPQGQAEVSAVEITLAPGAETGWHSHPVASFAYVLEGDLEVTLEDGRQHRARRGQALAEVVGLAHNGRNIGEGPVRLIVFYTATPDATLTLAAPR